jgi:hypothetical protein
LLKVFRTETSVELTPAVLVSSAPVRNQVLNGTAADLDTAEGSAGPAGGQVTFTVNGGDIVLDLPAGSDNISTILGAMNAQLTGYTVTLDTSNRLVFTSNVGGADQSIAVKAGTGEGQIIRTALGLVEGESAEGAGTAAAGELFYLTETLQVRPESGVPTYAAYVTLEDDRADSDLIDRETLYTTGDRGAVSGVLDFTPPLPSSYIAAARDRIVMAGKNELVQISQRLFPNEAVTFADPNLVGPVGFAYQARVEGKITGVAALNDTILVGTRDELFAIQGEGPNYVGVGEFAPPMRIPADTGFYDWRSIVNTPEGLWFQGDVDKLYLFAGGAPLLDEAPRTRQGGYISGAACTEGDVPLVAWAVGDAARLVVRDLTNKQWMEDTLPAPPARAFIEHRGRFYFVQSNGDVWREKTGSAAYRDGTATAYSLQLTTGTIMPFGMQGWGRIGGIDVLASSAGSAASVQLEISYDDGLNWTSLGTQTVASAAENTPVRIEFTPAVQKTDRFKLRLTMTPTGVGSNGPGVALHGFTLYVRPKQGGPRFGADQRQQ